MQQLLYDLGYEKDNITLIQTSLLMSSWSDTSHDHKDSWHWMGLAVSSAYAMGLNKGVTLEGLPRAEQKLYKRIWWSCYMRDRFLSLGLQRPTRIKDDDVSVPNLEISDFDIAVLPSENDIIRSEFSVLHSSEKQIELAELSVQRSKLSILIGYILQIQDIYDRSDITALYSNPESAIDLENKFLRTESALELWRSSLPISCEYELLHTAEDVAARSASLAVHQSHLQMSFHTLTYTLHRPRFLPASPKKMSLIPRSSSSESGTKVFNSAVQISHIAHNLRELNLDGLLPVTGVTIIFPAMVVSLLEMKNQDESTRHGAVSRFATCMRVMETLQETYIAADFTINYFKAALKKASITVSWAEVSVDAISTQAPTVLMPQDTNNSVMEDSLMLLQESLRTSGGEDAYDPMSTDSMEAEIKGFLASHEAEQPGWVLEHVSSSMDAPEDSPLPEWDVPGTLDASLGGWLDTPSETGPEALEATMAELVASP